MSAATTIFALVSAIQTRLLSSTALSNAVKAAFGTSGTFVVDLGFDPDSPPELATNCGIYLSCGGRSRLSDLRRRVGSIDVAIVVRGDVASAALFAADAIAAVVDDEILGAAADSGCAITPIDAGTDLVALPICAAFLRYSAVLAR